jgi:hypothetical protein
MISKEQKEGSAMRNENLNRDLSPEYIYVELHRVTEEEFEMWDQEPCIASED